MRSWGVPVLASLVLAAVLAAGYFLWWEPRRHQASPEQVAQAYFTAWGMGDLSKMRDLVADPPEDFTELHRQLSQALSVTAVSLTPGPLVRQGTDQAQIGFTVTRTLSQGEWSYKSTLRLSRHGGSWAVDWTPGTLYPGLKSGAMWSMAQVNGAAASAVARDGKPLPDNSTVQGYLPELADSFGQDGETTSAIELTMPGQSKAQLVKVFGTSTGQKLKTTIDRRVQAAADAAVHGSSKPAAVVAIRPSTGEILAVGDTLGARAAFLGLYPPGSTFKVVTAAALVGQGMGPGSAASCPHTVVTAQRTINNHEGLDLGTTTLSQAFAQSCNTTFSQLAVDKAGGPGLAAAARLFGFGGHIDPGVTAAEGDCPPDASGAALAEAGIGQGTVQASPLAMALIAAAVDDGEWRPPRLVSAKLIEDNDLSKAHPIPGNVTRALRPMMRAVVTRGTGAAAGLPGGVYGKTGTAEYDDAGHSHAWFIGYRGDLAFAVFVQEGESGPKVAAPLAAKFLNAL